MSDLDELREDLTYELSNLGMTQHPDDLVNLLLEFEAAVDAKARADEREKLREMVDKWSDESRDWYYAERHTHENGIDWVGGFESGWDHAASLLLAYLTARNGGGGDDQA